MKWSPCSKALYIPVKMIFLNNVTRLLKKQKTLQNYETCCKILDLQKRIHASQYTITFNKHNTVWVSIDCPRILNHLDFMCCFSYSVISFKGWNLWNNRPKFHRKSNDFLKFDIVLVYNIVLVSWMEQCDSVIHIYLFFGRFFFLKSC